VRTLLSMNGRFLRSLCLLALLFASAAIGISALAAGDFAFSPPTGWTKLASGTNMRWVDQTGKEYVIFHPTSFNGDLDSFVNAMLKKERVQYPSQHVWTNKNYYVCGHHVGRYVIWTSSKSGQTTIWEQMLALWGQDGYAISYLRPESHPPSSAARASLLSICGVGETVEPAGGVPVGPQHNAPAGSGGQGEQPQAPTPGPTGTISHPYMPVIPDGG
jgi:hypothetical protein